MTEKRTNLFPAKTIFQTEHGEILFGAKSLYLFLPIFMNVNRRKQCRRYIGEVKGHRAKL